MTTSSPVPPRPALVVGLGSPDRGDDAVGASVARAVGRLVEPPVVVVEHADPTDLLELWTGHEAVVVVDATWSGVAPGTLRILETGAERDPLPEAPWRRPGGGGTHAFGLAAAVELARVLRRLPRRVTVVGVEAEAFRPGAPMSCAVASAVPDAVRAVLRALAGTAAAADGTRGSIHVPR